jgi:hypothetical protein
MTKQERYKSLAAECLRLAQETANPSDRALLLHMAQVWLALAEKAARA